MILKEQDNIWRKKVMELDLLLSCNLTPEHRQLVEKEQRNLKKGADAEAQVAYDLNFRFRNYKNWVVLHDLRLVDGHDVAQIDHLLIVRTLDFFVLETKNYARGVRISPQGEFEAYPTEGNPYPIESPLAQNDRHIMLLQRVLKRDNLIPSRMGLTHPIFHNYVLISSKGRIDRPTPDSFPNVIKGDLFFENAVRKFQNTFTFMDAVRRLPQAISQDNLKLLGEKIASLHQPAPYPNYRKQFEITEDELKAAYQTAHNDNQRVGTSTMRTQAKSDEDRTKHDRFCFECRIPISDAEAQFCFTRKAQFGGRAYCRAHQKNFLR